MKKILRIVLLAIAAFLSLQILIFWLITNPQIPDMSEIDFRQAVERDQISDANFFEAEVQVVDRQGVKSRVPMKPTQEFRDELRQRHIRVNYEGPSPKPFSYFSSILVPITMMLLLAAFLL